MHITQLNESREKLKNLRIDHRQLDLQIKALTKAPKIDNLEVRRLKKRKLSIKDTIVKLESQLIPDLNA